MDSSGSVVQDPGNWGLVKDFIVRFVNHLPPGRDRNHYGLVQFSRNSQREFGLDRYYQEQALATAILNIRNLGEQTNTQAGLRQLRQEVFGRGGDRQNVPNIAIVITDGRSTEQVGRTLLEADLLKDTGALVIAVGITNEVNTTELRGIASADEYVITARSFLELEAKLEEIIDSACSLIVDRPDRIGPPGMLKVYNKVVFTRG